MMLSGEFLQVIDKNYPLTLEEPQFSSPHSNKFQHFVLIYFLET